ncbi:Telomerase reverse transcriptase [Sorochytrium milnesiophthora]
MVTLDLLHATYAHVVTLRELVLDRLTGLPSDAGKLQYLVRECDCDTYRQLLDQVYVACSAAQYASLPKIPISHRAGEPPSRSYPEDQPPPSPSSISVATQAATPAATSPLPLPPSSSSSTASTQSLPISQLSADNRFRQSDVLSHVLSQLLADKAHRDNILCWGYQKSTGHERYTTAEPVSVYPNALVSCLSTQPWEQLLSRVGFTFMTKLLQHAALFQLKETRCLLQLTGSPLWRTLPSGQLETRKRKIAPVQASLEPQAKVSRTMLARYCTHPSRMLYYRHETLFAKPKYDGTGKHVAYQFRPSNPLLVWQAGDKNARPLATIFPVLLRQSDVISTVLISPSVFQRSKAQRRLWRLRSFANLFASAAQQARSMDLATILFAECQTKVLPAYVTLHVYLTPRGRQKKYPVLQQCSAPYHVTRYLTRLLRELFPAEIWGTRENFRALTRGISRYVRLRRFERISLGELVCGIKVSDIKWISGYTTSRSSAESLVQQTMLFEFVHWIMRGLVMPVIQTSFYVTEAGSHRKMIFYYRHDVWRRIVRQQALSMSSSRYRALKPAREELGELCNRKKMGISAARLVPKESGMRVIVNSSKRTLAPFRPTSSSSFSKATVSGAGSKYGRAYNTQPVNMQLQSAHAALWFERSRNPDLVKSCVVSDMEMMRKFRRFKQLLDASPSKKVYCVKVDIRAAFDSLDQRQLVKLIEKVIKEDEYVMQKQITYTHATRDNIQSLLREYIESTIIKFGGRCYLQQQGIAQGSVVSTILCNLLYDTMEADVFAFLDPKSDVLLHFVDDFLLLSTDLQQAVKFVSRMAQGIPQYGCMINVDKTVSNIPSDAVPLLRDSSKVIPWCGLLIDARDFTIHNDYARYVGSYMSATMTVECSSRPGETFRRRICQFMEPKFNVVLFDRSINPMSALYVNAYGLAVLAAQKTACYVTLLAQRGVTLREELVNEAVLSALDYFYPLLQKRMSKAHEEMGDTDQSKVVIPTTLLHILACHAYVHTMTQKSTRFLGLLLHLRERLQSLRIAHAKQNARQPPNQRTDVNAILTLVTQSDTARALAKVLY